MEHIKKSVWFAGMGLIATGNSLAASKQEVPKRPNIVLILADDMGYSDITPYGGEIHTPNLDTLAQNGVKFTNFQVTPYSGPSRAALLTGTDPHTAGLGNLNEITRPEQRAGNAEGYRGALNSKAVTLAEYLQKAGYRTILSGKWHLGYKDGEGPENHGFDRSLALMRGEYYHFKSPTLNQYGLQTTYGVYNEPEGMEVYRLNGKVTTMPDNFFSTINYTDFAIQEIENRSKNQPFFVYLAYTAPHSPLQAPEKDIAKYADKYIDGPQKLADSRMRRLKQMGLIAKNIPNRKLVGTPEWDSLSADERAAESKRMQVYAAMVDNMDSNIGRLMSKLRERGELKNTIFVFLSDNGAAGASRERDARWGKWVSGAHNNQLEKMGSAESYISTGPDWAQASNTPYYLFKGYTTEGGIRSPLIISGPGVAKKGIDGAYGDITDITPTLLSLAHISVKTPEGKNPITGINLSQRLAKPNPQFRGPKQARVMEMMGGKMVKKGDYKAVATSHFAKIHGLDNAGIVKQKWQLFNVINDPAESHDLAKKKPTILKKLVDIYKNYSYQQGVVEVSPTKLGD
ncbi:MAG: arylsulfatase [Neisseria sp.]|uniref:arylsulfatase n=1 Tax=Neisseria sp. TaxID=192066 RepID=UPI0026DB3580|nr:arylsulfatase [Neisseria sp.]MDO4249036.1 arylsulfatase [Neisseria sp.]